MKPDELPAALDGSFSDAMRREQIELEKKRILVRDQRMSYGRLMKQDARTDDFWKHLEECIQKVPPITYQIEGKTDSQPERSLVVMLSDVHYGIAFKGCYGEYSAAIAAARVMRYAQEICDIQKQTGIQHCVVTLLGDMVSGTIHQTIRIENRENLIQQIVGVSELTASFLRILGECFSLIDVYSVGGNHSRIDLSAEDALRGERVDTLVPWYCKAKLSNLPHIHFCDNTFDESFSAFTLYQKNYLCAHGDFDGDLKQSAIRLGEMLHMPIDYFLVGHLHVPDIRLEQTGYIRNGAVLSGGDEYTSKKRLYAPAYQVTLIVSERGIDSIHPIKLS